LRRYPLSPEGYNSKFWRCRRGLGGAERNTQKKGALGFYKPKYNNDTKKKKRKLLSASDQIYFLTPSKSKCFGELFCKRCECEYLLSEK